MLHVFHITITLGQTALESSVLNLFLYMFDICLPLVTNGCFDHPLTSKYRQLHIK